MNVLTRISDIIHANLHSMVERAQDPHKLLQLMMQQIDEALAEGRTVCAQHLAEQKHISRQQRNLTTQMQRWQEKAELALSHDNEALARSALAHKHGLAQRYEQLRQQHTHHAGQLAALDTDLSQLQQKRSEAMAKARQLASREQVALTRLKARTTEHTVDTQQAQARFDAYQQRIERLEAQADSQYLGSDASLDAQFAELAREASVDQDLAKLKARHVA